MYDPTKPYKGEILKLIRQTWDTPYVTVRQDSMYPIVERKFSYPETTHTDGIGTKGVYHWQKRTFRNASLDTLAMNLNDLAIARAVPYQLQNHTLIPEDDTDAILQIIETLADECRKRDIAITGGETSVHNNIHGIDISTTVSGFIREFQPNRFEIGDHLVGIGSSGLHSNGFTKVREVFHGEYRSEFVEPTVIYSDALFALTKQFDIHGMMHITGGAYTRLKDLSHNADIRISRAHKLKPQPIFEELHERGISDEEMYKTFNCGIGFVLSASPEQAGNLGARLAHGDIIGEVVPGTGKVHIESMFSNKPVIF